jgi:hypothetical protein
MGHALQDRADGRAPEERREGEIDAERRCAFQLGRGCRRTGRPQERAERETTRGPPQTGRWNQPQDRRLPAQLSDSS